MKRQHPNNPDLFWCPRCHSYKPKSEYHEYKENGLVKSYCKLCKKEWAIEYRKTHEQKREILKKCELCGKDFYTYSSTVKTCSIECARLVVYGDKIKVLCPICGKERIVFEKTRARHGYITDVCQNCHNKERLKNRIKENSDLADRIKNKQKVRQKRNILNLSNGIVAAKLRAVNCPVTPDTLELRRQQILMRRTLKQFKQWRKGKEDESNYTDVHGEQCKNEADHEG